MSYWASIYSDNLDKYFISSIIYSSFMMATILSNIFGGKLSDLYGRLIIMYVGLLLYAVGNVIFVLENNLNQVISARVVQGVGAGFFIPSALAYIAEIEGKSLRAYAIFNVGLGLGLVLGPIIGTLSVINVKYPFQTALILSLISLILATTLRSDKSYRDVIKVKVGIGKISWKLLTYSCITVYVGTSIAAVLGSVYSTYIGIELKYSRTIIGSIFSIMFITYVISQVFMKFLEKTTLEKVLLFFSITCPLTLLTLFFTKNLIIILLTISITGLILGFIVNLSMTIASMASKECRGLGMSVFNIFMYLGMASAPLILSFMISILGVKYALLVHIVSLIVVVLIAYFNRK